MKKIIYISWQPYCSRSDNTARELHGISYKIYYNIFGSNYYTILLKYFFQTIKTSIILIKETPDIVIVMSPPVFANIIVYIYCKLFFKRYIIDAHTGAFKDNIWKNVQFLQKFFSKKALFSIITNQYLAEIVKHWEGDYLIIPDIPIIPSEIIPASLKAGINITLINTFSPDEPLDVFLEATRKLPEINFYITGKINKKTATYTNNIPKNVTFTNFLPEANYYGQIVSSDLVVVLTTRDQTMLRGAYEAIYLNKPVIISNWNVLRKNFAKGAIFIDNSVNGIESGIKEACSKLEQLTTEAKDLRKNKIEIWKKNKQSILARINGDPHAFD